MVKSIFELERRFDFDKEFNRLINLLDTRIYDNKSYRNQTFWTIANMSFLEWQYRLTATNISQYFEDLDIDFDNIYSCDNTHKMYVLQFIDSYIIFLINNFKIDYRIVSESEAYKPYLTIIKNISHIISKLNFKRDVDERKETVTYIKRDADTDSILSIIENEDDLRLALLEYNDFRIENDVDEKKKLIFKIYQFIELHKKDYQEKNNTLYKSISHIVNNYKIRHSNSCQISLNDSDTIEVYDICFKMMIHLIRDSYIKDSFKKIKEKHESNM